MVKIICSREMPLAFQRRFNAFSDVSKGLELFQMQFETTLNPLKHPKTHWNAQELSKWTLNKADLKLLHLKVI